MGLILLDINYKIEHAFKIRFEMERWANLNLSYAPNGHDVTLAELHEFLLKECAVQGVTPPANSWMTLVQLIDDASGIGIKNITTETSIVRDIAPYG